MQGDGNLVEYTMGGRAVWNSGTQKNPGARAVLQGDGNFVVYSGASKALWNTRTGGSDAHSLVLRNDGLLDLVGSGVRWTSGIRPSELQAGDFLLPGHVLYSGNGMYRLIMQGDGNLVQYFGGRAIWNTGTAGNPGARVILQGDGNLVVYPSGGGTALWNSKTAGTPANRLVVQDDSNVVLYGSKAEWDSGIRNSELRRGETLVPGQSLSRGQFRLIMQGDGNLVLYRGGKALWNSRTNGHPGAFVTMQSDGNLVVYRAAGTPLWNSKTAGSGGTRAVVQSDGNFVIYRSGGKAVWNTGTNPKPPGNVGGGPIGDDYPFKGRTGCCDTWQFYYSQCTSFVAWRMNRDHGAGSFNNYMGGFRWSNAQEWDEAARGLGYAVNSTPAVGAIAHWNGSEIGSVGHVAYVGAVHGDGTITLEEYNFPSGESYGTRRIPASQVPRFIHFR